MLVKTGAGTKAVNIDRIVDVTFVKDPATKLSREEFRNLLTLKLDWGVHKGLPLGHLHFDTFRLEAPPLYKDAWGDRLLVFRLNGSGEIDSFSYLGHDFKKVKPEKK